MAGVGSEFTKSLLVDAGIRPDMRVLDVGCGSGDVALIAAGLVGPGGAVVGIDREAGPLEAARERTAADKLDNVTFVLADIGNLSADLGSFDALVGRRVLMYQRDTVAAVRALAKSVRPGGLIVFHEHDTTMVPASLDGMPLHRQVQGWLKHMLEYEGADIHMGFNLYDVLTRAGLAVEAVRAEAIVQTPASPYALGQIVRAVWPRIVAAGVVTEEEIGVETLDRRLDDERLRSNATYVGDMMFGAWARKP